MMRYSLFIILFFVVRMCSAQAVDGGVAEKSPQSQPDRTRDSVAKVDSRTFEALKVDIHHVGEMLRKEIMYEKGVASYYSQKSHGHKTASGERHDRNAMICAHKRLPFGTLVRVVNEKNKKEVVVRVNDRGPFGKGRVIDLSYGAARELGMLADGIVQVSLFILE